MKIQDIDFKSDRPELVRLRNTAPKSSRFRSKILFKLAIVSAAVVLLGFSASSWHPVAKGADSTSKLPRLHYALELPGKVVRIEPEFKNPVAIPDDADWKIITIKSGDTLASIFDSAGIPATTTHAIASLNKQTKSLAYILPGQKIHLLQDDQNGLRRMKYFPDITKILSIQRNEDQTFSSKITNYRLQAFPVFREGVIERSLFEAAAKGNIAESVIMDLAYIFGWDIDFSLDIRRGDRFGVVYNELYKDNVKISGRSKFWLPSSSITVSFIKPYTTSTPQGKGDYFNEVGKSMRKAFLRSPVNFARISSRFNNKRWHPVLSKWRSHRGVDYAAARGTPVKAAGDGKIKFIGTKGWLRTCNNNPARWELYHGLWPFK